ncbi:MAG: glutathione S-transferase domain-containing protein, partial [Rhizobiales bacterium]|nr:glutathione S-transferase domain-containing protein [Hyphomicrobiales bacterium]
QITGPYFAGKQFHLIDGVWGTIFRYLDTFDGIADFGLLADAPKVTAWRKLVSARPSVVNAVPQGYPQRLTEFLRVRNSYLSSLMQGELETA